MKVYAFNPICRDATCHVSSSDIPVISVDMLTGNAIYDHARCHGIVSGDVTGRVSTGWQQFVNRLLAEYAKYCFSPLCYCINQIDQSSVFHGRGRNEER